MSDNDKKRLSETDIRSKFITPATSAPAGICIPRSARRWSTRGKDLMAGKSSSKIP